MAWPPLVPDEPEALDIEVPIKLRILRRGSVYGYELVIRESRIVSWHTPAGYHMDRRIDAWRVAMRRVRDYGAQAAGI